MGLQRDGSYNITELITYEIVTPIVDCSYTPLTRGADTNVRVFYILRRKTDPNDLMLYAVRFSMQDYKVQETQEYGPFGLCSHSYIKDMAEPRLFVKRFSGALGYPFEPAVSYIYEYPKLDKQGWWIMNSIPPNAATASKRMITSSRTGFYVSSDSEQANIKNLHWTIDDDPATVLSKWNWKGEPVLKDAWAWVHFLHAFFAFDALVNLLLLLLVIYRNLQKGKVWIGDAFVSVSTTLLTRGVLILLSWLLNGFWALMEFCLCDAHALAATQDIFIHADIMRADLLTLYLALASAIGYLFQERIDPAFVVLVFEIGFRTRPSIVKWFPRAVDTIVAFAETDHNAAVLGVSETVALSSPLRLWTTHVLPRKNAALIASCLLPIFISLVLVVVYVAVRKLYRRVHRDKIYKQDSRNTTGTNVSEGTDAATMVLYKRNLTLFEIATDAELFTRYGVVCDYENFLFIKGTKYASADGVYSNGFVIANGKWLVATEDLLSIAIQKLTRMRLRNIYAFAVDGNTVQLLGSWYPSSFSQCLSERFQTTMPIYQEPDSDARVTPMRESARQPKLAVLQPRRVHPPTPWQAFALLRRLLGLVAAVFCLYSTISSGYYSVRVLLGASNSSQVYMPYTSSYIARYLSNGTITESNLVYDLLVNDTTPRDFSVYLDSPSSISVKGCSSTLDTNAWLYGNSFLRSNLAELVTKTSYNLTFFSNAELIVPIIDCSFTPIAMGDATASRVYYVMRDKHDHTMIFLVMVSISTQDYRLPHQHTLGPAALVILTVIDRMDTETRHHIVMALGYPFRGPDYEVYSFVEVTKEGFVTLDSVPADPKTGRAKRVLTANRSGFFLDSEQSQSNIKNLHWTMPKLPAAAISTWQWVGTTMLRNSWGWVRYVNFFFSLETAFNLLVLLLVIYHNFQKGKIWIGDAFISFSDTLLRRGAIILILWVLEGFWSLNSFTLREGNILGKSIGLFYFRQIIHGDLLTIYISLAGLLGHVLRERINPALVVALFEFGFQYRHAILKALPGFVPTLVANANADYMRGIASLPHELEGFSPYRFKSIHELYRDPRAIMTALFPVFSTFLVILIYTPVMKLIRWTYARQQRRYHGMDIEHRGSLTAFEIASGAALQNRVGLVCDYDSCVYIKGLKFASPDGIYCNGFVIANGKWLIRTGDLMAIIFMIVTRVRFYDLYVYEVKDHTVNQTAVLVYPTTMTLSELLQLNTTLLA